MTTPQTSHDFGDYMLYGLLVLIGVALVPMVVALSPILLPIYLLGRACATLVDKVLNA